MKKLLLLLLLILGYAANAQTRSIFNSDNEIYNNLSETIWKVDGNNEHDEPKYYIQIKHRLYNEILIHDFTLSQLREIYCYALDYMEGQEFAYKKTMYWAKLEHSHGIIQFKVGFNSKRKPYTKVELCFYDEDWIHSFSETLRLESLLKWIGEDFDDWRNPNWKNKYCYFDR